MYIAAFIVVTSGESALISLFKRDLHDWVLLLWAPLPKQIEEFNSKTPHFHFQKKKNSIFLQKWLSYKEILYVFFHVRYYWTNRIDIKVILNTLMRH